MIFPLSTNLRLMQGWIVSDALQKKPQHILTPNLLEVLWNIDVQYHTRQPVCIPAWVGTWQRSQELCDAFNFDAPVFIYITHGLT